MKPLIHRLWLGPKDMPEEYVEYGRKWQELNPTWEVVEWTADMLTNITNQAVLDDIDRRDSGRFGRERAVQWADVIGYELIYKYGGIYVNTDIEPVRPLRYLLDHYDVGQTAYAPMEDYTQVVNCAIGGPAEHPFWAAVIDELPHRYFSMPGEEMNVTTGPRLLTYVWQKMPEDMFTALPIDSFNATHWSDVEIGTDATGKYDWESNPNVIGIHHWGHRKYRRTNYVEEASQ